MTHPVAAALRERPPGTRLALVVEGGGMRGAVTGGMVLGLDELGLEDAFDAAYGSSAGTLNAMWLVSGRVREGVPTWIDPALVGQLIRRRRALVRRPVVDVARLVDERYEQLSPGLFGAVLAAGTELHPIATDVASGEAVDLHGAIEDERTLRLALRASATLPLLAGAPVALGGRSFVDAGLSAAIPFRAALEQGATHALVLRSRREGEVTTPPTHRSPRTSSASARPPTRPSPAASTATSAASARRWTAAVRRCWMRWRDLHLLDLRRRRRHRGDRERRAASRELHRGDAPARAGLPAAGPGGAAVRGRLRARAVLVPRVRGGLLRRPLAARVGLRPRSAAGVAGLDPGYVPTGPRANAGGLTR
jgi:predicted patatin/cPLA2 family phospholipase